LLTNTRAGKIFNVSRVRFEPTILDRLKQAPNGNHHRECLPLHHPAPDNLSVEAWNNPQMLTRILASWFKFDMYYKLTAVYAASILRLLHRELRRVYLEKSWGHQKSYIEPAVRAVRKAWRQYFKPTSSAASVVGLDVRTLRFGYLGPAID
jgi:hypothetical protein